MTSEARRQKLAHRAAKRRQVAKVRCREMCPHCGSGNTVDSTKVPDKQFDTRYAFCADCGATWEQLPVGEPRDWREPLMRFAEPCDNCAFRPGSPEQREPEEWKKLLTELKAGGNFYCHKGVPFELDGEAKEFKYPLKPDGTYETGKMRLCAGFVAAWSKWMGHEFKPEQEA